MSSVQAPNTIIIEVYRGCRKVPELLGAHKWIEFLKNPTDEERGRESRVFYCLFTSGREVQKIGEGLLHDILRSRA